VAAAVAATTRPVVSLPLAAAADPDTARQVAKRILADPRFHPRRAPRPFAGFFRRVGELVVDPVGRLLGGLSDRLPHVGTGQWLAVAALVVAAAAVSAVRLSAFRDRRRFPAGGPRRGELGLDPDELERRAEDAEREGYLEIALRLRFRAGLGRLDQAGVVRIRPGLTNSAVSRAVRSRRFDTLAGEFDEVVYGGRAATEGDVASARAGWPAVVEEARRG
jgi:hypothetical protein